MTAFGTIEFVYNDDEDAETLKRRFAALFVREPTNPMRCAQIVFSGPDNVGRAMQAAQHWPYDSEVIGYIDELSANMEAHLPSKEQVAREILTLAQSARGTDDRIKAYELYGKFMGHIMKEPKVVVNSNPLQQFFEEIENDGRPKPATA